MVEIFNIINLKALFTECFFISTATRYIVLLSAYLEFYSFHGIFTEFTRLLTDCKNSAIKISAGNLDTNIFIPKGGILFELSVALDKMSKRLKSQINSLQHFENLRSEFIVNISHEIKTLLTGILSSVEMLEENPEEEVKNKCLTILRKQSLRLNTLVKDILSLSEIERRQLCEKKDFNGVNITDAIKNSISIYYLPQDIKINTNLQEAVVAGDISLLEQAFTNLITNAIKYSQSEIIDITSIKKDNTVEISVKDYGIGIPEEHLSKIFEHFYRVDKGRSKNLGGTGLGLSIVKNIVDRHNGTVCVKSDGGCEFIITLPLLT